MTKDAATLARELQALILEREDEIRRLQAAVDALLGRKRRGRPRKGQSAAKPA